MAFGVNQAKENIKATMSLLSAKVRGHRASRLTKKLKKTSKTKNLSRTAAIAHEHTKKKARKFLGVE